MAELTLRLVKGSELTFQELDDNFTNLNTEVEGLLEGQANFYFDGAGSELTNTMTVDLSIPYNATIDSWILLGDVSGSVEIDIKKHTYSGYPSGSSIVASAPPLITSAQKNNSSTLTGWTTSVTAGDILTASITSATTITRASLFVKLIRT